jgi:hypothetical protein
MYTMNHEEAGRREGGKRNNYASRRTKKREVPRNEAFCAYKFLWTARKRSLFALSWPMAQYM